MKAGERSQRKSFPHKLYELLEDEAVGNIVCWSNDGESVRIKDAAQMEKTILPFAFNQTRFASFVRQLHSYGFRKQPSAVGHEQLFTHNAFSKATPRRSVCLQRRDKGDSQGNIGLTKTKRSYLSRRDSGDAPHSDNEQAEQGSADAMRVPLKRLRDPTMYSLSSSQERVQHSAQPRKHDPSANKQLTPLISMNAISTACNATCAMEERIEEFCALMVHRARTSC